VALLVGGPPEGVEGFDWLWIVLAVLLDLSHYGNTWEQRGTIEAGMGRNPSPRSPTPPSPPVRPWDGRPRRF
jgi:hypothetical protein